MKNVNLEFFCSHCRNNVIFPKENILPIKITEGAGNISLIFKKKCPKCLQVETAHGRAIPNDIKLEILDYYSNISDETYKLWILEAQKYILEKRIIEAKEKLEGSMAVKREIEQEPGYQKRLFPDWMTNEKLIKVISEIEKTNN